MPTFCQAHATYPNSERCETNQFQIDLDDSTSEARLPVDLELMVQDKL